MLERLRIFTREDFSGDLELEISATALIDAMTGDTRTVSREVTVQVEAVADRLEVNVSQSAEEGTEAASPSLLHLTNYVEKTDEKKMYRLLFSS